MELLESESILYSNKMLSLNDKVMKSDKTF